MRINFVLLLFATLLASCKKELKTDYKNLRNVEFAGLSIPVPGIYVETDLDNLEEWWRMSNASASVVETEIKHLETLKLLGDNFTIYVDTTEISNTILLLTGPYIKIGKWTSQQLYKVLDKRLRAEAMDIKMDFNPIENNYYTLKNGSDILKVKFEWSNTEVRKYGTQYLLNLRGGGTFSIVVMDDEDDFEGLVRRAKFIDF